MSYADDTAKAVSEMDQSKLDGLTYEMAKKAAYEIPTPSASATESDHYGYFLNVLRRARELRHD